MYSANYSVSRPRIYFINVLRYLVTASMNKRAVSKKTFPPPRRPLLFGQDVFNT